MLNKNLKYIIPAIILLGLFCWLQVRPSIIRSSCQQWAYEQGNEYINYDFIKLKSAFERSQLQVEYMEGAYKRCIQSKGLE